MLCVNRGFGQGAPAKPKLNGSLRWLTIRYHVSRGPAQCDSPNRSRSPPRLGLAPRRRLFCATCAGILLVGSGGAPAGEGVAAPASLALLRPGPFAVGELELTLVDRSRATAANGAVAASPERVLETSVWYPARHRSLEWLRAGPPPLAPGACPSPLVIYSHGFMSFRHNGAYLATHLASHGYVVAAANFPLTHFGTPGGPQFHDVLHLSLIHI
mgnify:FL=1